MPLIYESGFDTSKIPTHTVQNVLSPTVQCKARSIETLTWALAFLCNVYLYLCDAIIQFEYLPLKLHKMNLWTENFETSHWNNLFQTDSLWTCVKYRGEEGRDGRSILHWTEMPSLQSGTNCRSPSTSQLFWFHIVPNSVWDVICIQI